MFVKLNKLKINNNSEMLNYKKIVYILTKYK